MVDKENYILVVEGQCEQHKADHSFRVMWLARRIFAIQLMVDGPEEIKQNPDFYLGVLDWAAVLHDREMSVTAVYDFVHGQKAATKVDELIGTTISKEGRELIKFLCIFHVPDDSEITGLSGTQMWLLRVFKDADSLDRVRFNDGDRLDESYLRFQSAKELIQTARELWERTKQGFDSPETAFDAVFNSEVE